MNRTNQMMLTLVLCLSIVSCSHSKRNHFSVKRAFYYPVGWQTPILLDSDNNEKLADEEYKTGKKQKYVDSWMRSKITRRAKNWKSLILVEAKKADLPPELVFAMIHQESAFDQNAISSKGAIGLMQLMKEYGGTEGYTMLIGRRKTPLVEELWDPGINIRVGVRYLAKLYHGHYVNEKNIRKRCLLVIVAYNTGPTNLDRVLRKTVLEKLTYSQLYQYLQNRLPVKETRIHVRRVTALMPKYRNLLSMDAS